jgi:ribosomal protein S18 acetylase RimI-like enzyme
MEPVIETEPKPEDVARLETWINDFNEQTTGICDGKLFAAFLRDDSGAAVGGVFGWTWGATCYVRFLYIPAELRQRGHGTRLMRAVEAEARARGCGQIALETHDFQAPAFYQRLGFEVTGSIDQYPIGHRQLTMVKRLAK